MVLENPLQNSRFPGEGEALAVLDTGYEGFLSVPREVFHVLGLDRLKVERRTLSLANGSILSTEGTYGTLKLPQLNLSADGFYETYPGLEEIILGTKAISQLRVLLDYCSGLLRLEVCP